MGDLAVRNFRRLQWVSSACLLLIFSIHSASAYTLTTTKSGHTIRWRSGQKLFLSGNPAGADSIDPVFFRRTVVNALQQWKAATNSAFDFEYWQGTNPSIYAPNLDRNGVNSVFFASNSKESSDPSVIGYTQVLFNENTGELLEADLKLNDRNFKLTSNIKDTSSSNSDSRRRVYLGNVITHELGHAIGLSHSGNINASMLYVEFSEQDKIGCDDWAAARDLYAPRSRGNGVLSGTIVGPLGEIVPGAQVTAISRKRGIPVASVHSDQSGHYTFGALEAGEYSLMIDHFQGTAQSVPANVKAAQNSLCSGSASFPTNFYTQADHHALQTVTVQAHRRATTGIIQLTCDTAQDSQTLFSNQIAPNALVDVAQNSTRVYHSFANGEFHITGLGYSLFSPVNLSIQVTDVNGTPIQTTNRTPLYESESGFALTDTSISGNAMGEILIQVTATAAYPYLPRPMVNANETPFYVLNFFMGSNTTAESDLPQNARCTPTQKGDFTAYQSPTGNPPRYSTTETSHDSVGFCGNAHADPMNLAHSRSHTGVPFGSVLGWFFPFLVAFLAQSLLKRRRA